MLLVALLMPLSAATPIPKDSKAEMDFRGYSSFSYPEYKKLFKCATYEELRDQLYKAVAAVTPDEKKGEEWEDGAQINASATCRLALIRTLYLLGEVKKADALLMEWHPVNEIGE